MHPDEVEITDEQKAHLIDRLKRRTTFIKYKVNGRTYSRLYYLLLSEDAIHYQGSRRRSKHDACESRRCCPQAVPTAALFSLSPGKIKDIEQVRPGFTTAVWKKCLEKGKITRDREHLAFSILYDNNRHSLDLLADSEEIRSQWIRGLQFLIARYRAHVRSHHEITDRWLWSLFAEADRDHSGHLNRREVRRLLFLLNIELDDRTIDQYFNQANIRVHNYDQLKNLDKDEFIMFYKFVSYRPELLKLICR